MRIGHGYDAHRFSDDEERPLWLGLVCLEGERGLAGHSDADVVTHALCDAILGAANLGDLGRHFSDLDPQWHGANSRIFLDRVVEMTLAAKYHVESADITVMAERPRLSPHLVAMGTALSDVIGTTVAVKATTTEGMGALGRGEGIAASAVALLREFS